LQQARALENNTDYNSGGKTVDFPPEFSFVTVLRWNGVSFSARNGKL
jgi:hypothetical protein